MNRNEVNTAAENLLNTLRDTNTDDRIRRILTAAVRKLGNLGKLKVPASEEQAAE